ncbi:extracellular solute-binding protein family 1 [Candidatus Moduliflexus flocculans]|uniref:Extracellular solute-binding protein family 1 n=1 Tax=Candidatus Moduliflexus flocculans TaxID=1499966 RepID=A0A081BS39_9BACT|nr:extracellular solute-binding protein family 1 [Candidatus Moduliflexus flocculans]
MKSRMYITFSVLMLALRAFSAQAQKPAEPTSLRIIYAAQAGSQSDDLRVFANLFQELSGIAVRIDTVSYQELYAKIVAADAPYDVAAFDQLWLASLLKQGRLAPLDEYLSAAMRKDIAPTLWKAFREQKQTWAMPLLVNVQLFYYNAAMLEKIGLTDPPANLEEMVDQMLQLKKEGVVEYPWTDAWRTGEELVAEYTWLLGAFGGELFNDDGQPTFASDAGVKALQFMVSLLDKQLANPKVLTNDDIAAKDDFITGQAAFTSNWTFLQGQINAANSTVKDQAKMMLIPVARGVSAKSSSVSAMQGIGILAASQQKEAAWKWISFVTSPIAQRAYRSEMPIWTSVQTSADINMLDPLMATKLAQLETVHYRPKRADYPQVSQILQQHLSAALRGETPPSDALKQAKEEIDALTTGK